MVATQMQPLSNGKTQANGFRQDDLSADTLATSIRRMLDWQNQIEKHLLAIREQLELSQWSLCIHQELKESELDQPVSDENTARDLLRVAAEFFEAARSAMAQFQRDCTAFTREIPDPLGPDRANALSDIFGEWRSARELSS